MLGNKFALLTLLLCGMFTAAIAEESAVPQDEIILKNGSKVLGTVTSARDGVLTVETDFAGTLSISSEKVLSVHTEGEFVVQMADGQIIRDKPITMEGDLIIITEGNGDQLSYAITDIQLINPEEWELGNGFPI